MIDLGNRLKTLRLSAHLTQEQVAKRIGITKAMISSYELSNRQPSHQILIKLISPSCIHRLPVGLEKEKCIQVNDLTPHQIHILKKTLITEFRSCQ